MAELRSAEQTYVAFQTYAIDHSGRRDALGIVQRYYPDGETRYVGVVVFERTRQGHIKLYHPLPGLAAYSELAPLRAEMERKSIRLENGKIVWYEYA